MANYNLLKERYGFNLRERMNVYGGIVLGALAPSAFMYTAAMQDITPPALRATLAAALSIPLMIHTIPTCSLIGFLGARRLKRERFAASGLESKVQ
jgi:hypothetical protein